MFLAFCKKKLSEFCRDTRGTFLIIALVFGVVTTSMLMLGVAGYGLFELRASGRAEARDLAFHIAEAGTSYYRWHLAHNATDYQDGTDHAGPYVHAYEDKDGNVLGYYSLDITPPLVGSTIVTVKSTGWTAENPSVKRSVKVQLGFPSLANYSFLEHAGMSFSATSLVHGEVHSNGCIAFNGTSDSWVKSAQSSCGSGKNGVYGSGGPTSLWKWGVPAVDFSAVTADLSKIRDTADDGGLHLTSSGKEGYHIVFASTTFKVYRVDARSCYSIGNRKSDCYDIKTETLLNTYQIPANGAIFSEDDVWVEGVVDGRVTIGVGRFPVQSPYKNIYLANNITYAKTDGTNVLGLIAQGRIVAPYVVPNNMVIYASMLSQFMDIGRDCYDGQAYGLRNSLTTVGTQMSYTDGGWKCSSWSGVVSGFVNTSYTYDGNLKYAPPPGFPVGAVYELLSWEEVE